MRANLPKQGRNAGGRGGAQGGKRSAREKDPVAVLGVHLSGHCAPPQTIGNTAYLIDFPHPDSLPFPPIPPLGTGVG